MKNLKFLLIISIPLFLANLSNQNQLSYHCSGEIFYNKTSEKIVDIKIGRSKNNAKNKEITVYKIGQSDKKIKYEFNLEQIKEIEYQHKTIKFDDEEFIKIKVITKNNQSIDCVIKKEEEIHAKVRETGWTAVYSFDQISKLVIDKCVIKDDDN